MESPSADNITILVVDDESNLVPMICEKLRLSGYLPLGAVGPREALNLSQAHQGEIQVLLADVVMPGMNGRDLANRIAWARPGIKVIFMSAYSDQILYSHGVIPKGVNLLRKPFRLGELERKIHEVLQVGTPWKADAA